MRADVKNLFVHIPKSFHTAFKHEKEIWNNLNWINELQLLNCSLCVRYNTVTISQFSLHLVSLRTNSRTGAAICVVSAHGNADKCLQLSSRPSSFPSVSISIPAKAHLSYFLSARVLYNGLSLFRAFGVFVQLFNPPSLPEGSHSFSFFCLTSALVFVIVHFLLNSLISSVKCWICQGLIQIT